jgi:hypothetical protein
MEYVTLYQPAPQNSQSASVDQHFRDFLLVVAVASRF